MKNFSPKPWFMPQAVIVIGTYDADGTPNAMNAAWAGTWDNNKIMISLGSHQTTANLAACPEFTVAFATAETATAADYVGIVSGKKEKNKVAKTGWTVQRASMVNAPVFADFPMTMECRVVKKIDESNTGCYLVAEIVNIVVDEKYLAHDGKPDLEQMHLITFDPVHLGYLEIGKRVGNAFADGKTLS
ncbi:MAG: flavin reductase [Sodaliphilus pleomorphus]|uniref:flavin reductase family protein n=1 Tax=Sodaliphilus pleomorphus TaxID=2606626 RepID=UPI0024099D58|nr:flavin reductase [Sodaliphilus pleomorphus]MDD6475441.1 flavin reductase [Sodaliphilus pleomorphus]